MLKPGTMMVSRAGEGVIHRHCGCCGQELTPHQAASSGICDKPRCRDWKIEQAGIAMLQRQRQQRKDRIFRQAAHQIGAIAEATGIDPDKAVRAALPWQGKALAPQDSARCAAFGAHLRGIVETAFAEPLPKADAPERAEIEAEEAPALSAACATCGGACCDHGGTTALLEAGDIGRWRRRNPQATAQEVFAAYMGHLPEQSVAGACVFLGKTGCTLPRAMRSDWCNRFACPPRDALQAAMTEKGGDVLMVAVERENLRPGAVGGWRAEAGSMILPVPGTAADGEDQPGDPE